MVKVELNLLDFQVDLILHSLKLYGYTLNAVFSFDRYEAEIVKKKRDILKNTYEQIIEALNANTNEFPKKFRE